MTRETMRRWKWIGGGFMLLIAGLLYYFIAIKEPEEVPEPIHEEESSVVETSQEEVQKIYVHVGGAVQHPDVVYILDTGARVVDAIEKAGGCTEDADLSGLNLAEPLKDGQKIYVPRQGESLPEEINQENDLTDLNKADTIELDALPGIGPALAERIIAYREEHGGFSSIEEIKNVKGIGDALFEELRDLITAE